MVAVFTTPITIRPTMRWRRVLAYFSALALPLWPLSALAASSSQSPVLLTELQTGSMTSASEEFIELANVSDVPVDLTNWRLEYFSAATTSLTKPFRTIPLHGSIAVGAHYVISSNNYLNDIAGDHYAATLAKAGGHVRLVSIDASNTPQVQDTIGWGTAVSPETTAASAPEGGSSLIRRRTDQYIYTDTNNNQADFVLSSSPTPGTDNALMQPDQENPETIAPTEPTEEPSTSPDVVGPISEEETPQTEQPVVALEISELLPNPAAPGNDSADEFIELYNPNDRAVELANYTLETGNTYSYSYTFESGEIAARSYQTFRSDRTKLVLANSAGRARLLAPDNSIISETVGYTDAKEGQTWAEINGIWQWTITPTPNADNILNVAEVLSASTKAIKPKTTSKAAAKPKKTTAKVASTKKAAKKSTPSTTAVASKQTNPDKSVAPIHPSILAGVAVLALLYAAYEYRHDIANYFHKHRSNRTTRRTSRAKA